MAPELLGLGPDPAHELDLLSLDGPGHVRHIGRDTAVYLPLESFDDLRPTNLPPLLRRGHLLARVRAEDLRKDGIGIGLALVVVGGVRTLFIRIEGMADGFDSQLVHHVLMVLLSRESDRLLRREGGHDQGHRQNGKKGFCFHGAIDYLRSLIQR